MSALYRTLDWSNRGHYRWTDDATVIIGSGSSCDITIEGAAGRAVSITADGAFEVLGEGVRLARPEEDPAELSVGESHRLQRGDAIVVGEERIEYGFITYTMPYSPSEPEPKRRLTRRRFLGLLAGSLIGAGAYKWFNISPPPQLADLTLGDQARTMIAEAWEGIDASKVVDIHTHVLGLGTGSSGCFVHPDSDSLTSPTRVFKFRFYKGAAGIYDDARADQLYVKRLVDLVYHQDPRGRYLLMAFDQHYDLEGQPVTEHTEFHTPNDYVFGLVEEHPKLFLPCASVHPWRKDAVDELQRCRDEGAVAIKWLPNAMGMDPLHPKCEPFYEKLAELKIPLISHAGKEAAVEAESFQELGNPLRLRKALDMGVKVVVAHCPSTGESDDLDEDPDAEGKYPKVSCYDLFRRLTDDPKYKGRVYGGLSAMTQFNRCEDPLARNITDSDLHPYLVNGSDYPLPAIDLLIRETKLEELGYISEEEVEVLGEIFAYNPLTFDFVLKRRLRVEREGETHRLPGSVFETAHLFEG